MMTAPWLRCSLPVTLLLLLLLFQGGGDHCGDIGCFPLGSSAFAFTAVGVRSRRGRNGPVLGAATDSGDDRGRASLEFPRATATTKANKVSRRKRTWLQHFDKWLSVLQDPARQLEGHTYLTGNYRPVLEERVGIDLDEGCVVEGSIPTELDGMLCRNGPNPKRLQGFRKMYHWFDGHGMLHNLRFRDGRATYTNQFVPSPRYLVEEEYGEDFFPTLGEYRGILGLAKVLFHPTMVYNVLGDLRTSNPPNTNVLMYNNKFYCLNESNFPFECRLFPDGTLEPVGHENLGGQLDFPVSAHPRVDHATGDLLFHSYTTDNELIERDGTMKVGRYSPGGQEGGGRLVSYFVPNDNKDYIPFAHNMVYTDNYLILWDCSVHFDPKAMFDGGSYFRTKPKYNLRFGIIPKEAASREEVVWVDTGRPGAVVHPLNAWEETDQKTGASVIVIWTPFCEDLDIDLDREGINTFEMREYKLDPAAEGKGLVSEETIDDTVNIEFSVVPTMGTNRTRFGYTAIQDKGTPGEGSFSGFCVWDMQSDARGRDCYEAVYYQPDEVGGEPILLGTDRSGLDLIGTHIWNLEEEQSYFLIFRNNVVNERSAAVPPAPLSREGLEDGVGKTNSSIDMICRLRMPHRVPFGFHGEWIPGDDLQKHFEYHGIGP